MNRRSPSIAYQNANRFRNPFMIPYSNVCLPGPANANITPRLGIHLVTRRRASGEKTRRGSRSQGSRSVFSRLVQPLKHAARFEIPSSASHRPGLVRECGRVTAPRPLPSEAMPPHPEALGPTPVRRCPPTPSESRRAGSLAPRARFRTTKLGASRVPHRPE